MLRTIYSNKCVFLTSDILSKWPTCLMFRPDRYMCAKISAPSRAPTPEPRCTARAVASPWKLKDFERKLNMLWL